MKLSKNTIEKSADVLIRLGEATLIGSAITFLSETFSRVLSIIGLVIGVISIFLGLYVNNLTNNE